MNCSITELRYALNGITEVQLTTLFELLDEEEDQIIFKRLGDTKYTISGDDLIFKGEFSESFISTLSKIFPPPLSIKMRHPNFTREMLGNMSCKQWVSDDSTIYAGNTILPNATMLQTFGYSSPDHMLHSLTSSPMGSYLKSYLITKPKGLIEAEEGKLFIILPLHRLDFIASWVNQVMKGAVSYEWLNGTSDELENKLIGSTGDLNMIIDYGKWIDSSQSIEELNLNLAFQTALRLIH